ncbi:MAG: hypothetical protein DELT_02357 [Desulfovibrio sp.]
MSDIKNVLLVGVGGQGTILASKILTMGLMEAGYDVKMSEVHGMAQRGGSVTTQVRYGDKVYSPIIGKGQGDVLVAFETMEALRILDDLKPTGKVIVNDYRMPSMPILAGKAEYPEGVFDELRSKVETTVVDASDLAHKAGNPRGMNVVLLGALVKALGLNSIDWPGVIAKAVKPQFVESNIKAFNAGYTA